MSNNLEILDIPFTTLYEKEVLERIKRRLAQPAGRALFIATPNPEILLASRKDLMYKKVIQSADINIPDGNGLIWAYRFLANNRSKRNSVLIACSALFSLLAFAFQAKDNKIRFNQAIHGSDLTMKICCHPEISRHRIFLLGNKKGLKADSAARAARKLTEINPDINLAKAVDSTPDDLQLAKTIAADQPEILLVGFGAPAQEIWLKENLSNLPSVKVAMGIGGTFDFIAGIVPRAPLPLRKMGLEWLYRLIKQPKRLRRIWNATVVFPCTIVQDRLANPDKYRIFHI